jgi:hypothetical protein
MISHKTNFLTYAHPAMSIAAMKHGISRIDLARVEKLLADLGVSERQASLKATDGRDPNFIGMLRRGQISNPRIDRMRGLAEALNSDIDFLTGQSDVVRAAPTGFAESSSVFQVGLSGLPMLGKVEAGRFQEVDDLAAENDPPLVYAARHPRFPDARHFSFEVVGDSMNALKPKSIMERDIVYCVDWGATGMSPRTDDIVVVERTRDGGHLREITLKQVEIRADGTALCPRSTNKLHREIWLPRSYDDNGVTVRIIGVVYSWQTWADTRF